MCAGGAGSFNLGTFYLAATTYAVTIGVGGVAVNDSDGVAGTQSLVAGVIAGYGGLGGAFQSPISIPSRATTRGCGGGGSFGKGGNGGSGIVYVRFKV